MQWQKVEPKEMKERDNSKIHISSNFILSICLLILVMWDTLLLRPSLYCNTSLHFTTLHPTTLHYTYRHFTSSHLHFTTFSFSLTQLHLLSFEPRTHQHILCTSINVIKETEQNQLTWYGHVQRMAEGRLPKIALKSMPKQKRARGRPKKTGWKV